MGEAIAIDIPEYFLCPISLQIMRDPVTTVTGITYDRESIEKWLSKADVCPVTKQPLPRGSDLTPNHMLRRLTQAWCVANAKNGIDRIPTPKSPLHRSAVLKLVRELKKHNNELSMMNALTKMDELLVAGGHEKTNRKLMADAGAANAVFSFVVRRCKDGRADGLDRALRILQLTWTASAEHRKVLEGDGNSCLDDFVDSALWILSRTDLENGSHVKSAALANLKNFAEAASAIHLEKMKTSLLSETVKVLRGGISPQAARSALQILIEASRAVRNRARIVEAGAVLELVEMELANPAEKRTTELIFCLLAQLCSCAEGRQRLLEHAGGVAVAAKRLLRVSAATDDRIMCVMESVARYAAPRAVVGEMLRVGGVSKLCMVVQADSDGYLKRKATEILRLHFSDWSNAPCIELYLKTRHD